MLHIYIKLCWLGDGFPNSLKALLSSNYVLRSIGQTISDCYLSSWHSSQGVAPVLPCSSQSTACLSADQLWTVTDKVASREAHHNTPQPAIAACQSTRRQQSASTETYQHPIILQTGQGKIYHKVAEKPIINTPCKR